MSVLSGTEQKEVSTLDKRTDHRKALHRRRFVRDCPGPRPDQRHFVVCSPRSWSELRELVEVWSSPWGAFAARTGAFAARTRKVDFSFQTIVDFVLILLGHALGLDHHSALLIFLRKLTPTGKNWGYFWQRELRKTDTAREVCVGMAAQIDVGHRLGSAQQTAGTLSACSSTTFREVDAARCQLAPSQELWLTRSSLGAWSGLWRASLRHCFWWRNDRHSSSL